MIERWITEKLKNSLKETPSVCLLGARQVGKTTLAKSLKTEGDAIYLDLENPEDQIKLSDPLSYFRKHTEKLIILDEIQRAPDLFMPLRGIIDERRENNQATGHFLFLGSASMDLLRQSSESLAGRIRYLEMTGLNVLEVKETLETVQRLWYRGGFPESYLSSNDGIAMEWLENLIRSYLERDVPQMGFRVPSTKLRRLWTMLAHLQGETINYSKLASNLEVDIKTVKNYLDILEDLLLVRRLDPWHENVKKRLIKAPRYYIRDSGIVHRLLGIDQHETLLSHPVLGKSWEGFVVENIHSILPSRAKTYFYRTVAGAEIDLVIILPNQEIWAVEIKYGRSPKIGKHFSTYCNDVNATKKIVIYGGEEAFPLSKDVECMSLKKLMEMIQNQTE